MGSEQELETWKPRRHVCMPTLMPYSSHLLRGRWQYKQILERNVFPRSIRCQGHMKKARRCAREYRVHPCNGHSAVASAHSNKCPNGHLRGDHISQGTVRHIIAELGLKTRAAACENIKSHPTRIFCARRKEVIAVYFAEIETEENKIEYPPSDI